jgi:hypothetical protein
MKIRIETIMTNAKCLLGRMVIDGQFQCFTLENPIRKEKIKGETAIPATMTKLGLRKDSPMAKRYDARYARIKHDGMLWLLNVVDFTYVYFHVGNTIHNTDGCILVGMGANVDEDGAAMLTSSSIAYVKIYQLIKAAIDRGEDVMVEVLR